MMSQTYSPYYCRLTDEGKLAPVSGRRVRFEGFEEFEFFVHPAFNRGFGKRWTISEARTGYAVVSGCTLKEVLDLASPLLISRGKDGLQKAIYRDIAASGEVPKAED